MGPLLIVWREKEVEKRFNNWAGGITLECCRRSDQNTTLPHPHNKGDEWYDEVKVYITGSLYTIPGLWYYFDLEETFSPTSGTLGSFFETRVAYKANMAKV
jgi:hypothetical protein